MSSLLAPLNCTSAGSTNCCITLRTVVPTGTLIGAPRTSTVISGTKMARPLKLTEVIGLLPDVGVMQPLVPEGLRTSLVAAVKSTNVSAPSSTQLGGVAALLMVPLPANCVG